MITCIYIHCLKRKCDFNQMNFKRAHILLYYKESQKIKYQAEKK